MAPGRRTSESPDIVTVRGVSNAHKSQKEYFLKVLGIQGQSSHYSTHWQELDNWNGLDAVLGTIKGLFVPFPPLRCTVPWQTHNTSRQRQMWIMLRSVSCFKRELALCVWNLIRSETSVLLWKFFGHTFQVLPLVESGSCPTPLAFQCPPGTSKHVGKNKSKLLEYRMICNT